MPQENESKLENLASDQDAPWMQDQLINGEAGLPQYPDQVSLADAALDADLPVLKRVEKPTTTQTEVDAALDSSSRPTQPIVVAAALAAEAERPAAHNPAIVCASNAADERVGFDIGDALAMSRMLDGQHVLVEIIDGEVYLQGTVADQTVRTQVELLSSCVPGAKRIHNELEVRR
jgi:hypothetical protein